MEKAIEALPEETEGAQPKKKSKKKSVDARIEPLEEDSDKPSLSEWSRRWVLIEPRLGKIDLRPYLFTSRDRKALFTLTANLPHMEAWVEKLCGERLEAKAISVEISKLPPVDAERYFNAVLTRVRSVKKLKKRPPGIYGLIEICKVQPSFQSAIISLLNSFSAANIGPWAVAGWDEIFTKPESKAAFRSICESWAAQDENKALKIAANSKFSKGTK